MNTITVPTGEYTLKHYRMGGEVIREHASYPPPVATEMEVCGTYYPAGRCVCGMYLLIWGAK